MTRTRLYRGGVLESEDFPVEDVHRYVDQPGATVWVDLLAPTGAELATISDALDLHQLAVEAATRQRQRPRVDRFDNHLLLTTYAVVLDPDSAALSTCEVATFVTPQALVTLRQSDLFDVKGMVARWDQCGDLTRHGVAFLLYGLLDYLVDGHFAAVQALDDEIEDLEDVLFDDYRPDRSLQRRSFELRKSLARLRRDVLPMREVVNTLVRRDIPWLDGAMTPYYQDVYGSVLRATEWTESLRDMLGAILEINLTIQGNRLNVITKQVTSWAAIIAVPTAVTGFYGQNVPYPGFSSSWGFYTSTVIIVLLSVSLYALFRRLDWI